MKTNQLTGPGRRQHSFHHWRSFGCLVSLLFVIGASAPSGWAANAPARTVYTLDADFAQGELFNVNFTNTPDQLELNAGTLKTFPIMWVANAGEDTVSKIDTDTGKELARYRTWFGPSGQPGYVNHLNNAYAGAAPSRTAVDQDGNCFVANRHFDGRPADVIKILATGGIDRNTNGVIDTSIDVSGDGIIQASEILPMGDANGNGLIDQNEIRDERIAWVATVGPNNGLGRSLAIDKDGNIWLGLYNTKVYYKLSGLNGSTLAGPIDVSPNTPYGALVDGNGILWGASLDGTLLKLDTVANVKLNVYNHGFGTDYGIAIGNGRVYQANTSGNTYTEFDPVTATFTAPAASKFASTGIAVDGNGDIFVGNQTSDGVVKFRPDGTLIWSKPTQPGGGVAYGCVVDSNNDVWLIHLDRDSISKYRGSDGAPLGVFPAGNRPYTYTDATGIGRFNTTQPSGSWTVLHDSGSPNTAWGSVAWNALTPPGTAIKVEVRAANTQADLGGVNFREVTNDLSFCDQGCAGQLIQVRATLTRQAGDTNTPVLYDLTIAACAGGPPVANCQSISVTNDLGFCSAVVQPAQIDNGSSDPEGGPVTLSLNPPGPYPVGTTPVVLTVTDDQGLSATCTATVTVVDAELPIIAGLSNRVVECGAPWEFDTPIAADNCGVAFFWTHGDHDQSRLRRILSGCPDVDGN